MNPFLGVVFHWLGGLASGSFYVPYKGVKKWAWEVYWLVGGFFSWIICPAFLASVLTSDVLGVLRHAPGQTLWWAYFFGAMWGFGGLTFGLTMRYLGMSLGMGVALGYCAAFGTLVPPIFKGEFGPILHTWPGQVTLIGVAVCLAGIGVAALAGLTKEREMPAAEKQKAIAEFSFTKGILVATFSGIMSACFAFGLAAGKPIEDLTYCSDIVCSAGKAGKTLAGTPLVDESETGVVQTLQQLEFAKTTGTSKPSLATAIEVLESPLTLAAQLAALETQLKGAKSGEETDLQKSIAGVKEQLARAEQSYPAQLVALKQASGPLAQRLQKYQADLESLRGKTAELNIIAGLKSLTRKEVAVAAVQSGVDFVALHKKHQLWTGLPVLIVVLLGGFTTNFIWCVLLNIKNKTGYQYFSGTLRSDPPRRDQETIIETALDAPSEEVVEHASRAAVIGDHRVPMLNNYLFSALAGTTWYFQFFFYTMGATQMGRYDFASWTLHMASIIIFSTMWGWILHEWKGSSKKAHSLIAAGIAMLILSTCVIGYGTFLKGGGTLQTLLRMIFG
jgi:hypothetical protein